MRTIASAFLVMILCIGFVPGSVAEESDDAPVITVFVAGPDPEDSDSLFGHTALFVQYPNASEIAYTYYVYAPDGSWDGLPSASIGRATMELVATSAGSLTHSYQEHGREIRRTVLEVTPDEARIIADQLEAIAEGEGRIPYDMITDNCSTRLRDLIDAAVDGHLRDALAVPSGHTVRSIASPYVDHRIVGAPLWLFLYGDGGDQEINTWDTMFLPLEFEAALKRPIPDGNGGTRTLLEETEVVTPSDHPDFDAMGTPTWMVLAGAGLGVIALTALTGFALRRNEEVARRTVAVGLAITGVFIGLTSVFIIAAWTGYFGAQAAHNQNVLIASPLAFLLPVMAMELWGSTTHGWRNMAWLSMVSLIMLGAAVALRWVPGFAAQDNMVFIAFAAVCWVSLLVLSIQAAGAKVVFGRRLRRMSRAVRPTVERPTRR